MPSTTPSAWRTAAKRHKKHKALPWNSACRKSATLQGGPFSACCAGQKTSWLRCPVFAAPVAAGLQKADRSPCSASAASAAGSASALQSPGIPLLDKIERRTAHSAQRASHTLCAQFPWLCPIHPHMSAGWDFFDSLRREGSSRLFCAYCRTERTRGRGEEAFLFAIAN